MTFAVLALAAFVQNAVEPPPFIDEGGIVNAASRMPPALAAGGIARGAIFHIVGLRLGGSIDLHAAGRTIRIVPAHATATRIVARMPPDAPLGPATITISREGQSSAPAPIEVVDTAFGIFYIELDPDVPPPIRDAIATGRPTGRDRPPVAKPGQKLYVFGTGLGAVRKLQVFVGNRRARLARDPEIMTSIPGVDRLAVNPDPTTPQGCYVPVQVVAAGRASNAAAIGFSSTSGACAETLPWLSTHAAGPRRAATIFLLRSSLMTDVNFAIRGATYDWDDLAASFADTDPKEPVPLPLPPAGTCTAYTGVLNLNALTRSRMSGGGPEDLIDATTGGASNTVEPPPLRSLNAGPALRIAGPSGARSVDHAPGRPGSFAAVLGGHPLFKKGDPTPEFLTPGDYLLSTEGGSDLGPLAATIRLVPAPAWQNRRTIDAVDRARGFAVRWTAAAPDRLIVIAATNTDAETGAFAAAICLADPRARSFRVPAHVLANIPKGKSGTSLPTNVVVVGSVPANPVRFKARGLDSGAIVDITTAARTVRFD